MTNRMTDYFLIQEIRKTCAKQVAAITLGIDPQTIPLPIYAPYFIYSAISHNREPDDMRENGSEITMVFNITAIDQSIFHELDLVTSVEVIRNTHNGHITGFAQHARPGPDYIELN